MTSIHSVSINNAFYLSVLCAMSPQIVRYSAYCRRSWLKIVDITWSSFVSRVVAEYVVGGIFLCDMALHRLWWLVDCSF